MTTLELWIINFDATSDLWDKYGAYPYLHAQDGVNYVEDNDRNNDCGYFTFETTPESGVINSVKLYMYAYAVAVGDFEAYIDDLATGLNPPTAAGWVNIEVKTILDTWAKINTAKLLLGRGNTKNLAGCDAAYLLIDYTAGTPVGWNKLAYESPPTPGWNKILFESEPPVNSAWNKIKYG